jgi:Mg2+ and Co2+ transporter CorA
MRTRPVFQCSSGALPVRGGKRGRGGVFRGPTMIAGIYGMNFEHMPELRTSWGYPVVLVVILGICLTLLALFRRNDWL